MEKFGEKERKREKEIEKKRRERESKNLLVVLSFLVHSFL